MPRQYNGSWGNALLLWSLATVVLFPLCASSPTPKGALASTADSASRWDPVCNFAMPPRYAASGTPNYYIGGGRDMWQEIHQPPAITTMNAFCPSDRGAQCFCREFGETMYVVDCPGHFGTHYPAWMLCQLQCACYAPRLPPPPPETDPNPFADLERYVNSLNLPF